MCVYFMVHNVSSFVFFMLTVWVIDLKLLKAISPRP